MATQMDIDAFFRTQKVHKIHMDGKPFKLKNLPLESQKEIIEKLNKKLNLGEASVISMSGEPAPELGGLEKRIEPEPKANPMPKPIEKKMEKRKK